MNRYNREHTVSVIEYDKIEYISLGIVIVTNATRAFAHDSSHTTKSPSLAFRNMTIEFGTYERPKTQLKPAI